MGGTLSKMVVNKFPTLFRKARLHNPSRKRNKQNQEKVNPKNNDTKPHRAGKPAGDPGSRHGRMLCQERKTKKQGQKKTFTRGYNHPKRKTSRARVKPRPLLN